MIRRSIEFSNLLGDENTRKVTTQCVCNCGKGLFVVIKVDKQTNEIHVECRRCRQQFGTSFHSKEIEYI